MSGKPIWRPDPARTEQARLTDFTRFAAARSGRDLPDYAALLAWSIEDLDAFWRALWDYFDIQAVTGSDIALAADTMPGADWFPGATLNYVDQVFRDRPADEVAVIELDESGRQLEVSWAELRRQTAALAATLRAHGVGVGDRVVAYLPNGVEAVVAFLATACLGAVWSACGMDYAPSAALGRFGQLEPVALIAADGYRNAGRIHDRAEAVAELRAGLPTLALTVTVPRIADGPADGLRWDDATAGDPVLECVPVPFEHPLWVLFSSGTTGLPKGIVHGHGGVLLEHLKALALQSDLGPGDRFWWYTSPSWMMWNLQVSGLLVGATIVCYDGSPAHPETGSLWQRSAEYGVTMLGTSPGYLAACAKAGVEPGHEYDLGALRTLGVTGSTLPASTAYWCRDHLGPDVQVASMSGGTDVVTAFAGGAPTVPVWAGEISTAWLGVALDAFDEQGQSVRGRLGELVITRPMPSMPVGFWDDPDGARYRDAYFDTYPGVWRHGDWVTISDHGSIEMHGRSDNTLNRNGIRMGSADIYEAVEQLPEITEAMVIGIDEPGGGYWMPLFVVLAAGAQLDDALRARITASIREHASPRHVPDEVLVAPGIPHTRTGKKLEVPVKRLLQGTGGTFDAGSVDDPGLIDWYLEAGRRRSSSPLSGDLRRI
ncbi:acetoacetate--CoA ligase [Jatrophihabitans sp.]|uniref:acetoacetate--CoA ligase n=1 Tax=Jatrophihabitans sp. TaxID=1932789 RepID=UPI0030C67AC8|nr:Acetoacetyl-CoA synthetase [Jatrophihabitans sp.]